MLQAFKTILRFLHRPIPVVIYVKSNLPPGATIPLPIWDDSAWLVIEVTKTPHATGFGSGLIRALARREYNARGYTRKLTSENPTKKYVAIPAKAAVFAYALTITHGMRHV